MMEVVLKSPYQKLATAGGGSILNGRRGHTSAESLMTTDKVMVKFEGDLHQVPVPSHWLRSIKEAP